VIALAVGLGVGVCVGWWLACVVRAWLEADHADLEREARVKW
jgi:hypothetical protein